MNEYFEGSKHVKFCAHYSRTHAKAKERNCAVIDRVHLPEGVINPSILSTTMPHYTKTNNNLQYIRKIQHAREHQYNVKAWNKAVQRCYVNNFGLLLIFWFSCCCITIRVMIRDRFCNMFHPFHHLINLDYKWEVFDILLIFVLVIDELLFANEFGVDLPSPCKS